MRHIPGIYSSTWKDMFIEITCMRLGHGPAWVIALITDWNQIVTLALGLFTFRELSRDIKALSNDKQEAVDTHYKEDKEDRCSIRCICTDLINDTSHHNGTLMNIVRGEMAHPDVKADNALSERQMAVFKSGWPALFHEKLSKIMVIIDFRKNMS